MRTIIRTAVRTTLIAAAVAAFGLAFRHPARANDGVHVVQAGETLYSIAASYGVSADDIAAANGIMNPDYIRAGQTLQIPGTWAGGHDGPWEVEAHGAGGRYVVKPGDTLYSIA